MFKAKDFWEWRLEKVVKFNEKKWANEKKIQQYFSGNDFKPAHF
jgi:hypothetical protein